MGTSHVSDNKAAVDVGLDHEKNLYITKNTDFEKLKTVFDMTLRLILERRIAFDGVSTIEWQITPWRRSTLLRDRAIKLLKA